MATKSYNVKKIAIVGAGNMGGALALGLAQSGQVSASDICVSDISTATLDALRKQQPSLNTTTDNALCVKDADLVIVVVKPWKVKEVLTDLKPSLDYQKQSVVCIAAGITLDQLDEWLAVDGAVPPLFVVIPNTAIAHMQSMTFMAYRHSDEALNETILSLFQTLGDAIFVDEHLMEPGMALASCGLAYALRYIRAATEGGVQMGFRAAEAQRIVAQTLRGAAALLEDGAHAEAEIDKVTTPGGRTIRGLNAMEQAGFTNAVIQGLLASLA